jgi:hypothetical protein
MGFVASVRQGPHAGTNYEGILHMRLSGGGDVRSASFHPVRGKDVELDARSADGVIQFSIPTPDGTLRGKGPIVADLKRCIGEMEGTLKGPRAKSRGDWLAASDEVLTLANGSLLRSSATGHVIYRTTNFTNTVLYAGVLNAPGNLDGPRLSAKFNQPSGIGQDASRNVIYVVDVGNRTVRRLDQGTGQMTTMLRATDAMTAATAAGFSITGWEPHGVAANNEGIVYVSDAGNHVVWQYNANTAKLKLLAGRPGQPGRVDGVGTAVRFKLPQRMGISPDGLIANLVDRGNCLVRQISRNGTVATIGSENQEFCTPLP